MQKTMGNDHEVSKDQTSIAEVALGAFADAVFLCLQSDIS
jgi:hypothetical protein